MKKLVLAAAAATMMTTGCAHEALFSELRTDPTERAAALAMPFPAPRADAAPDGAICTYGTDCLSSYCSAGVCEHTDIEDGPAEILADARAQ